MKRNFTPATLLCVILMLLTTISLSDSPPPNTIPIIGLKCSYEDIDTDFFCFLSWHNLDGLSRQWYDAADILEKVVLPADTTGMIAIINPNPVHHYNEVYTRMFNIESDYPYTRPGWYGHTIWTGDTTFVCDSDTLIEELTVQEMKGKMSSAAALMDSLFNDESSSVWLYYAVDEGPARQWNHMVQDTIDDVYVGYDNFMPNLFTQEMEYVLRPDLDSVYKWQPTLEEIDPRGVLSWMNHYIHEADSTREFCYIISTMHTIYDEWAYYDNLSVANDSTPSNFSNQAQVVRSLFSMEYQDYVSGPFQPAKEDNYPSSIAYDAYPFRLVGTEYQTDSSYTPQLGDSLDNWMLDHYEIGMDSTFITAWNIMNDDDKDISVFFIPQAIGRAGGTGMWASSRDSLVYNSYNYRVPTPQEFRMTCNSALIRGAKAIFPYCLTSYMGSDGDLTDVGLLDQNNIPYNAPYEDWVYRDRPTDSITYIPPDSIPPFMEGYDPLYTLPDRPDTTGQKENEIMLEWKFAAYGRLWDHAKKIFGDIARVAPELALLNWWNGYHDDAGINYDGTEPSMFRTPQVRVFTDSTEETCYLFYLNRYCRANDNPFKITVNPALYPSGTQFSTYALDHNRRCLIEGTQLLGIITFKDTLNAGEARLLQMFDSNSGLVKDVRITDTDLTVILPAKGDTLTDYQGPSGTPINLVAEFYNMGTASTGQFFAYLKDETTNSMLDTVRVSIDGLSTSSCYTSESSRATFSWTFDSDDIGVHVLKVYTSIITGEEDTTDNTASLVYVVNPKDYATTVLDNPWDMTESTSLPKPLWNTSDIKNMTGCWDSSAYTDSITGMFEGELTDPRLTNAMYLNTGTRSSDYIDADTYHNLSLAGRSRINTLIEVHWIDSDDDTSYVTLNGVADTLRSVASDLGPWDLSYLSNDWSGDIKKLWLEFNGAGMLPVSVRIGWIKLTE